MTDKDNNISRQLVAVVFGLAAIMLVAFALSAASTHAAPAPLGGGSSPQFTITPPPLPSWWPTPRPTRTPCVNCPTRTPYPTHPPFLTYTPSPTRTPCVHSPTP